MKKIIYSLICSILYLTSYAQIDFKSGSLELDRDLNSINTDAKLDLGAFKMQLKTGYNVDDKKIDYMSTKLKMEPAEIYFALEIGKTTNKPIDEVLVIYQKEKKNGWGNISKQAGIKPGSPEFHAMKSHASGKAKKGKGKGKGNSKGDDHKDHEKDNKNKHK